MAERFGPVAPDVPGAGVSVVVGPDDPVPDTRSIARFMSEPALVVVRPSPDAGSSFVLDDRWKAIADAVVDEHDEHDAIVANVDARPRAAIALALLMRPAEGRDVHAGLAAESMTYSLLQGGPEFAAWRASRPVARRPPPSGPAVLVDRVDDVLEITLNRPEVRNAFNTDLRDELLDALAIAEADRSITRVELRGNGPSYSSGGDLDEFGSFPDPATAHLIRLQRSVGRVIASMRDRVVAHVHGACYGSGVEIPAFAGTVVADPDSTFALPELGLGLVPGAGGTVSLTVRIGRHRTTALVLSGRTIDASTALAWGVVDEIATRS